MSKRGFTTITLKEYVIIILVSLIVTIIITGAVFYEINNQTNTGIPIDQSTDQVYSAWIDYVDTDPLIFITSDNMDQRLYLEVISYELDVFLIQVINAENVTIVKIEIKIRNNQMYDYDLVITNLYKDGDWFVEGYIDLDQF